MKESNQRSALAHHGKMIQTAVGTMGDWKTSKGKKPSTISSKNLQKQSTEREAILRPETSWEMYHLGKAHPREKDQGDVKPKVIFLTDHCCRNTFP